MLKSRKITPNLNKSEEHLFIFLISQGNNIHDLIRWLKPTLFRPQTTYFQTVMYKYNSIMFCMPVARRSSKTVISIYHTPTTMQATCLDHVEGGHVKLEQNPQQAPCRFSSRMKAAPLHYPLSSNRLYITNNAE
jgi:hypothetical protein